MNSIFYGTEASSVSCFDNNAVIKHPEIQRGASLLNHSLQKHPTNAQQGVCILMSRGAHYLATILAAWEAGFYVVPLNTAWPLQKNLEIINRIKPAAVLVDDGVQLDIDYPCLPKSNLFNSTAVAQSVYTDPVPLRVLLPSDIAYVIFTSGSTGEPKGVVVSAGAFRSYIDWTRRYFFEYAGSKRLLLTSELTFDITMGDIAFALAFGTDIGVAIQNTNIPSVLAMIMHHKVDVLYSVPTTHLALVSFAHQKRGADLSTLKLIMSGGDRFPWQLVRDYTALTGGAHFFNVYGPTEVTINCFAVRLDDKLHLAEAGKAVPIGECFDSLDHLLLDDNGMPADEGELCVAGPQLMFGYHSDPIRTESAFVTDPRVDFIQRLFYRTGDIGYRDGGLMYLKGRVDGLIKIRGYRIHPDEVSKALDTLDGVDVSAVVSFGKQSNAALAAFIKLKPNCQLSSESIHLALKELIPIYMIPSRYEYVDKFPLNQSGKIDKKALSRSLA